MLAAAWARINMGKRCDADKGASRGLYTEVSHNLAEMNVRRVRRREAVRLVSEKEKIIAVVSNFRKENV